MQGKCISIYRYVFLARTCLVHARKTYLAAHTSLLHGQQLWCLITFLLITPKLLVWLTWSFYTTCMLVSAMFIMHARTLATYVSLICKYSYWLCSVHARKTYMQIRLSCMDTAFPSFSKQKLLYMNSYMLIWTLGITFWILDTVWFSNPKKDFPYHLICQSKSHFLEKRLSSKMVKTQIRPSCT